MFYHLKITFRNLKQNALYSWINIAGLTISITVCTLMILWIHNERSFDKFHKRSSDIYMAVATFEMEGMQSHRGLASPLLALNAKKDIPEIENACRMSKWNEDVINFENNMISGATCGMVDPAFFSMFNFRILDGDQANLLPDNYSVVLSESVARTLFGEENPIGKTITDTRKQHFHVTGLMADMPQNSSNRYDVIFSFSLFESSAPFMMHWDNLNFKTYFLLYPGVDVSKVAQGLTDIHHRNSNTEQSYSLMPLVKENLYKLDGSANSKLQAVRLFTIIVFVLLLVACINYVNLVTARASRRNKEIFIRRIAGAKKLKLFWYFFSESLWLFFISLTLAACLTYVLFPVYNQITGNILEFHPFSTTMLVLYGCLFLVIAVVAGIYPALNLSLNKNPKKAGSQHTKANNFLRKSLVVTQFAASVILILGTVVFSRQMHFIQTKNLGYDKEYVFYVRMPAGMNNYYNNFKTELSNVASIEASTFMYQPLSNVTLFRADATWENQGTRKVHFNVIYTDKDFMPTMGVKLLKGENFTGTRADSAHFIVNQKAVNEMGMEDPIGKRLTYTSIEGTIIGVAEDFHFESMHEEIKPLIMVSGSETDFLYVKIHPDNAKAALAAVEKVYKGYNTTIPFNYRFLDDEFEQTYKTDLRTSLLFKWFALVAILVSCLGLFGLISFTAETRTKEIGIRKVLGANVKCIVFMLSKDFLVLLGIAMLIAFPFAYYWLSQILQDYAYRTNIPWWIFVLAATTTLMVSLLTVGWQAFKAATANPVKSIKTE